MIRFLRRLWDKLFASDAVRAQLLRLVAEEAAALVISLNPNQPWASLLANVIQQIAGMADPPTRNQAALQRAAAAALLRLGKSPH